MSDKTSSGPGKGGSSDASKDLEKAFDAFETEILETVEKTVDDKLETEAQKAEDTIADTEKEVQAEIDKTIDALKPKPEDAQEADPEPEAPEVVEPPKSAISDYRRLAFGTPRDETPAGAPLDKPALPAAGADDTSALNAAAVQSVSFQNEEAKTYAPTMVVTPPDQMIGQAAGLAAQASAQYFDSMTKVVMASQSVMLKKMAENVASGELMQAAEDGLVIAETELLLAGAMAVAAAGGAMEAESASFGISKINESVQARTANAKAKGG